MGVEDLVDHNYLPLRNGKGHRPGLILPSDKAKLDGMAAIYTVNGPLFVSANALGLNIASPLVNSGGNLTVQPATNAQAGSIDASAYTKLSSLLGIYALNASHLVLSGNTLNHANPSLFGTNTQVGDNSGYGSGYASLWSAAGKTASANHYMLLGDASNTYVNVNTGGIIHLRVNNADVVQIGSSFQLSSGIRIYGPGANTFTGRAYGTAVLDGPASGGYAGLAFYSSGTYLGTFMYSGEYSGLYVDDGVTGWRWLWDYGTLTMGTIPVARLSPGADTAWSASTLVQRRSDGYLDGLFVKNSASGASGNVWVVDDLRTYRSANTNTGVLYLNQATSRYLFFDGTNYQLAGASLIVNGTTYASSQEYKTGITVLKDGALERLKKLTPKLFAYKETPNDQKVGFIYEDVIQQEPAFGSQTKGANGEDVKSLDYTSVFVLNVKATQELAAGQDDLKRRVGILEAQVAALLKRPAA